MSEVDNVLSQNEIDDLLKAFNEKGVTTDQIDGSQLTKVRNYDFKRPNKFSKDHVNTLHNIYENYARSLSSHLSVNLHAVVETHLISIEQITYSEFINSLPNPTIIGIASLEPLGSGLVNLSPGLAFTFIERLLGGSGDIKEIDRELTELERTILDKRVRGMVGLLPEAWENIIPLTANLLSIEPNPQFVQIVGPAEMVALITIEIRVGQNMGMCHMCLPYLMLEPVLPKLSTQVWFNTTETKPTDQSLLLAKLDKVYLPIRVELGTSSIFVRDLLQLGVGDVLPLQKKAAEPLAIYVGSKAKFLGRPGMLGNRVAVQVIDKLSEGDEIDE